MVVRVGSKSSAVGSVFGPWPLRTSTSTSPAAGPRRDARAAVADVVGEALGQPGRHRGRGGLAHGHVGHLVGEHDALAGAAEPREGAGVEHDPVVARTPVGGVRRRRAGAAERARRHGGHLAQPLGLAAAGACRTRPGVRGTTSTARLRPVPAPDLADPADGPVAGRRVPAQRARRRGAQDEDPVAARPRARARGPRAAGAVPPSVSAATYQWPPRWTTVRYCSAVDVVVSKPRKPVAGLHPRHPRMAAEAGRPLRRTAPERG